MYMREMGSVGVLDARRRDRDPKVENGLKHMFRRFGLPATFAESSI